MITQQKCEKKTVCFSLFLVFCHVEDNEEKKTVERLRLLIIKTNRVKPCRSRRGN